jgi:hypothetical protein
MVQRKLCGEPRVFSLLPCPQPCVDMVQRKGRRLSCPRHPGAMAPGVARGQCRFASRRSRWRPFLGPRKGASYLFPGNQAISPPASRRRTDNGITVTFRVPVAGRRMERNSFNLLFRSLKDLHPLFRSEKRTRGPLSGSDPESSWQSPVGRPERWFPRYERTHSASPSCTSGTDDSGQAFP